MPKEKTTQAKYFTLRLNPVTSAEDSETLNIIRQLESEGYTFKQIAQDAILARQGYNPEMFSKSTSGYILGGLENLLTRFAGEIVHELKKGGKSQINGDTDDDAREEESPLVRNLARSFMQRQQKALGDEE